MQPIEFSVINVLSDTEIVIENNQATLVVRLMFPILAKVGNKVRLDADLKHLQKYQLFGVWSTPILISTATSPDLSDLLCYILFEGTKIQSAVYEGVDALLLFSNRYAAERFRDFYNKNGEQRTLLISAKRALEFCELNGLKIILDADVDTGLMLVAQTAEKFYELLSERKTLLRGVYDSEQ